MKKYFSMVMLAVAMLLTTSCGMAQIEGNERAVTQDMFKGVSDKLVTPGTFFYAPIKTEVYTYNIGTAKFIMGKAELYASPEQIAKHGAHRFVDYGAFTLTTGGGGKEQPATFSLTMQYHLDPSKLVALHNEAQDRYEDLIIRPALTRIISDKATPLAVLDFYSGTGKVNLQKDIEQAITDHPALSKAGIIVTTLVFDEVALDEDYVAQITGRQLATQKKLRAIEETKAETEIAKKEEAIALADKLKRIVAAEGNKEVTIRKAQALAEKVKLDASADRFRKEEDAKGLLAQGKAEAKVADLKRIARYAGESGRRQAAVEINQARVEMFKNLNINGVVPEKTMLTMINGATINPVLNVGGK